MWEIQRIRNITLSLSLIPYKLHYLSRLIFIMYLQFILFDCNSRQILFAITMSFYMLSKLLSFDHSLAYYTLYCFNTFISPTISSIRLLKLDLTVRLNSIRNVVILLRCYVTASWTLWIIWFSVGKYYRLRWWYKISMVIEVLLPWRDIKTQMPRIKVDVDLQIKGIDSINWLLVWSRQTVLLFILHINL
jgi:hypothetical protein